MHIFISHSHENLNEALAVRQWLIEREPSLAEEIFLDYEQLFPGIKWRDALSQAADRCKAVLCLLSAAWDSSPECVGEYVTAELLKKKILPARLEKGAGEKTRAWQQIDLFVGETDSETIPLPSGVEVTLSRRGLDQLRNGIRDLGLIGDYFPWPPEDDKKRSPYRGWAQLDSFDAAIFFGRDDEIARGMRLLGEMLNPGRESMLVIQAPSGAGKSAFLRAGLIPRLLRDDRTYLPLDVIRPERAAVTGEQGLAAAITNVCAALQIPNCPTLGEVKAACLAGRISQVKKWLQQARDAAKSRLIVGDSATPPPVPVFALDQGEELFTTTSDRERSAFLKILAGLLIRENQAPAAALLMVTIRTDAYNELQDAEELKHVVSTAFTDLREMPPAQYRDVIVRPAERAAKAGQELTIDPELTQRLLKDCKASDAALPLLALALERLYLDYGRDGDLTLQDYKRLGGLKKVVQTVIDGIIGDAPPDRERRLQVLHDAFIPALASINVTNDRGGRRIARVRDLPDESQSLIAAFVDNRLLVKRERRDGEVCVEIAIDSLLRQWTQLAEWLDAEGSELKLAEWVQLSARRWQEGGGSTSDLILNGDRLRNAEVLADQPRYSKSWPSPTHEFLLACRKRQVELDKEDRRRRRYRLALVASLVVVALIAVVGGGYGLREHNNRFQSTAQRLIADGQAMLSGDQSEGDYRGLQHLLAAPRVMAAANEKWWQQMLFTPAASKPADKGPLLNAVIDRRNLHHIYQAPTALTSVAVSADKDLIAVGGFNGALQIFHAQSGLPRGPAVDTHHGTVWSVAFVGPDVVTSSNDGTIQIWDAAGSPRVFERSTTGKAVRSIAATDDGHYLVAGDAAGVVRVWDTVGRTQYRADLDFGPRPVQTVAVHGTTFAAGSDDGTIRRLDLLTGAKVGEPFSARDGEPVWCLAFSPSGDRLAAAGRSEAVWLYSTADTNVRTSIPHYGGVWTVAFGPGDHLATGGIDDTVRVWDLTTHKKIADLVTGDRKDMKALAFFGDQLVSVGDDGTLRVWNVPAPPPAMPARDDQINGFAFSDGRIFSVTANGVTQVWDTTGAAVGPSGHLDTSETSKPVVETHGPAVAFGSQRGIVLTQNLISAVPGRTEIAAALTKDPTLAFGGNRIAVLNNKGVVDLWDAHNGAPTGHPVDTGQKHLAAMALSPNGKRLVAADDSGDVHVWNTDNGQPVTTSAMHGDADPDPGARNRVSVAFSSDGERIVTGAGGDDRVREWDVSTGQQVGGDMIGHQRDVTAVAFSEDRQYIASGAQDGTVRLWDATIQRPVGRALSIVQPIVDGQPATGRLYATVVAFSPGDRLVVAGLNDGTIRIWPGPAAWPSELCAKLTQVMGQPHWEQWVAKDIGYVPICPNLPTDG